MATLLTGAGVWRVEVRKMHNSIKMQVGAITVLAHFGSTVFSLSTVDSHYLEVEGTL